MIKEGTCIYLQTEVHINDQLSLISKKMRGYCNPQHPGLAAQQRLMMGLMIDKVNMNNRESILILGD